MTGRFEDCCEGRLFGHLDQKIGQGFGPESKLENLGKDHFLLRQLVLASFRGFGLMKMNVATAGIFR